MAKKIELGETEQATVLAEQAPKAPAIKKPRRAAGEKKAEKTAVVAEKPAKKKPAKAVAKKAVARKPGPAKKKVEEKPKEAVVAKAKKARASKPGRIAGIKTVAEVPVVTRKKRGAKKPGLIGRKADLIKMGEGAFLYSLDQQQRIDEMAQVIANYERVFEAVRHLFSREMEELEELVAGLLE
jgi:hypothetical protein